MTDKPTGREALDEIERRFSQLLGRLGQTFEEAMSLRPGQSPFETRVQSFSGTVEEFLAKRRAASVEQASDSAPEASDTTEPSEADPQQAPAEAAATVSVEVPGGRVTLDIADPGSASEGGKPEIRFGAAWRISVAGGTLRFDPD